MQIQIEVTQEEIRSAIERKVRVAIADQTNQFSSDRYIREQVKAQWESAVDALVKDALANSQELREKIAASLERKLRAQLDAALKAAR